MEKQSDIDLMKRVIERDTSAFKQLYQRYELRIFNFILRYTKNREIAQDLLQETFTRMWFAAHTFDQKRGQFQAWLYTIALNITRSEMVKKQHHTPILNVDDIQSGGYRSEYQNRDRPDIQMEKKDINDQIADALSQLQPDMKEIIILKTYEGFKFREIAQMTHTPEGTLKARYHRAIAQLKKQLGRMEL